MKPTGPELVCGDCAYLSFKTDDCGLIWRECDKYKRPIEHSKRYDDLPCSDCIGDFLDTNKNCSTITKEV
jgi:hypothetical protein